jgi:hypothetical protein
MVPGLFTLLVTYGLTEGMKEKGIILGIRYQGKHPVLPCLSFLCLRSFNEGKKPYISKSKFHLVGKREPSSHEPIPLRKLKLIELL